MPTVNVSKCVCWGGAGGWWTREVNRRVFGCDTEVGLCLGRWADLWQPLAPVCPMGSQLGTDLLYWGTWDLGTNQDTSDTSTAAHTEGGHTRLCLGQKTGCGFRNASLSKWSSVRWFKLICKHSTSTQNSFLPHRAKLIKWDQGTLRAVRLCSGNMLHGKSEAG